MMFTSILQSEYVDRDETFESLANKIVAWLELYWTLREAHITKYPGTY